MAPYACVWEMASDQEQGMSCGTGCKRSLTCTIVVSPSGTESCHQLRRSIMWLFTERYRLVSIAIALQQKWGIAFGRTRTCNLLLRRQTPYPLGHKSP